MKRFLVPFAAAALALIYFFSGSFQMIVKKGLDAGGFGSLPVLTGGRVKPLDTVARTSLLMIRGKQTVRFDGRTIQASEWLLDVLFRPAEAAAYPIFQIDDPDVLGLLNVQQSKNRYYSFKFLEPFLGEIEEQSQRAAASKPELQSRFQKSVGKLHSRIVLYQRLSNTIEVSGETGTVLKIQDYKNKLAAPLKPGKGPFEDFAGNFSQYQFLDQAAEFFPLPYKGRPNEPVQWVSLGKGLIQSVFSRAFHPAMEFYASFGDAWRAQNSDLFNRTLQESRAWLLANAPQVMRAVHFEMLFNHIQPFYKCMILYVVIFLLIFISWIVKPDALYRAAFSLLVTTFALHTLALVSRMLIQGRPPVTNLYSSAIFVGWCSVLLGLILEKIFRRGLGGIAAALIGFSTLIIAHHLAAEGDTMEMMRAVLDSNFWLATHVVCITIGYGSTFLSGFLAIVHIFRRHFDSAWNDDSGKVIERMVYGIVCFSVFFSFLGTVLGGIWADQSWGRFWGWDPKENGALMIVLWNVFILHSRMAGLAPQRRLMVLAVFGNIITALSWFGVNMLGIGLHSYGFMDQAFVWLSIFVASQALLMVLGLLPDGFFSRNKTSKLTPR